MKFMRASANDALGSSAGVSEFGTTLTSWKPLSGHATKVAVDRRTIINPAAKMIDV